MKNERTTAFLYETLQQAEAAISELQENGTDIKSISVVMANFKACITAIGYHDTDTAIKKTGDNGSVFGRLSGAALIVLQGMGPILVIGAFSATILKALDAAPPIGPERIITAALLSLGIPLLKAQKHEALIKTGKFLLVVQTSRKRGEQITKYPLQIAKLYLLDDDRKIILSER